MATASRVFWESVLFVSFLAVLIGVFFWSGSRVDRRASELTRQHEEALVLSAEQQEARLETMQRSLDDRLERRLVREAEAILAAFEAGSHTAIAARWGRYLASARDTLVSRPEVTFMHILTRQGRVITSSDPDLAEIGQIDEESSWVLDAAEIESRPGTQPDSLEVVSPVREGDRTVAILWIGYDLQVMASDVDSSP